MQTIAPGNPFAGTVTSNCSGSRQALGAVMLTGYLGGAVATHVRVGSPLLTQVLFPAYVAALLWAGLVLRDARLRAFLPWRDRGRS